MPSLTVVQPVGYDAHSCGYCSAPGERSKRHSSRSFGLLSDQMTPRFYQDMIDRGWRRSGNYTYHPDMAHTCCPQYTIRLDAAAFKPARQQRSAVNRWNRFLSGDAEGSGNAKGKGKGRPFELVPELRRCQTGYAKDVKRSFEIEFTPAEATDETYALFRKYQMAVHHDPPHKARRPGFERFLCNSPLSDERIKYASGADTSQLPQTYGSYHMLYRVDGELVGISVIDVLPACVSSVYFIWDPDWAWAGLGKLSALYEIALVLDMAKAGAEDMKWLYMGYWIATCPKMRYKGDYAPSELLDPDTYEFHPLTTKLDRYLQIHGGYTPFKEIEAMDDKAVEEEYRASKGLGNDVEMAEPKAPRPKRAKAGLRGDVAETNGDDASDSDESEADSDDGVADGGPTQWPTPPPPGLADPSAIADDLDDLFVLIIRRGEAGVVPYNVFQHNLTKIGRELVAQLVAAMGEDMFARSPDDMTSKALLHF